MLLGRRAAMHTFMPDLYVFPGGRRDAGDHRRPFASDLHPLVTQEHLAANRRPMTAGSARALALAAIRELTEETGLQLGAELSPTDNRVPEAAELRPCATSRVRSRRLDLLVVTTRASSSLSLSGERMDKAVGQPACTIMPGMGHRCDRSKSEKGNECRYNRAFHLHAPSTLNTRRREKKSATTDRGDRCSDCDKYTDHIERRPIGPKSHICAVAAALFQTGEL